MRWITDWAEIEDEKRYIACPLNGYVGVLRLGQPSGVYDGWWIKRNLRELCYAALILPPFPNPEIDWFVTYTGKQFWPLDPKPENVCIEDIAHALALNCRFAGHCRSHYSVAQHSVLGTKYGSDITIQRCFLMHDSSEAYLPDAIRPIKKSIPEIKEADDKLLECIFNKYKLPWPMPAEIKEIDNRMLMTEKRDLTVDSGHRWSINAEPYSEKIQTWSWQHAEAEFLAMFAKLFPEYTLPTNLLPVCDETWT